jgi:hypothetical protein
MVKIASVCNVVGTGHIGTFTCPAMAISIEPKERGKRTSRSASRFRAALHVG